MLRYNIWNSQYGKVYIVYKTNTAHILFPPKKQKYILWISTQNFVSSQFVDIGGKGGTKWETYVTAL